MTVVLSIKGLTKSYKPGVPVLKGIDLDFSERGKVKRLDLGNQQRTIYSGEANAQFKDAKPFRFLGV